MAKKKLSYEQKMAMLSEYSPCLPYKKGSSVTHDAKIFRALEDIEVPEPWNEKKWKEIKNRDYTGVSDKEFLQFENIRIKPSLWHIYAAAAGYSKFSKEYEYRAFVHCSGATPEMMPYVVFGAKEALSGKFSNITESRKNGVYIFCRDKPKESIVIPMVKFLKPQYSDKTE